MANLLASRVLVDFASHFFGPQKRRPNVALRGSLEDLESRALLSASGGTLDVPADVQAVHVSAHGRMAVPRIDGVAGTFSVSGGEIGTGTLTITQEGQQIAGTFDTSNLISGSFNAQFRTPRARTAKGTAEFVFVGEEVTETYKFRIRFKANGDFSFRYR